MVRCCRLCSSPWACTRDRLGVVRIDQDGVHAFEAVRLPYVRGVFVLPVVVVVYYLVWKYIVGFLNDLVGID